MSSVLGIETSCDETGVAIYDSRRGLLVDLLHSQIETHAAHGGVVPELASRDHIRKLAPMVRAALEQAGLEGSQLDGVAYTAGPGLLGALLVGGSVACGLAAGWNIPVIPVHHMEGHLLAPMLEQRRPDFPFIALLVSGGHSMLVEVDGIGRYKILGETLDDAAGEAFDKTAKLLGLGYPGGAALARLAEQGRPGRFKLPRPMAGRDSLDFSFSGLKTAALLTLRKAGDDPQTKADFARAFEDSVVGSLVKKSAQALERSGVQRLVVAGGVGANRRLRTRLAELPAEIYYPRPEYCTDNAAMIAHVGCLRLAEGQRPPLAIAARARWPLDELRPIAA